MGKSVYRYVSIALLGLVCIIGLATVSDYGMSWDEPYRFYGGNEKLAYYQSFFNGEAAPEFDDLYPGLFDLPLAIFRGAFPDLGSPSQQGHVLSLLFGLVALAVAWRLCSRLGGERAGFWALLFLVATPRFYGHMFFNPKDIPFAAMYLLSVYLLVEVLLQLPRLANWKTVASLGFACGLALSARIGGVLLLFYFAFFIFCFLALKHFTSYRKEHVNRWKAVGEDCLSWAARGGLAGVLALAVLLVFWPVGHSDPLGTLYSALTEAQEFGWNGIVLMDGHFWKAQDLPAYYIPYWLKVSMPEWMLLLLIISTVAGGLYVYRSMRARNTVNALFWSRACVFFSALFPLAYMLYSQPVLYDGMRHFLFVLPIFACICALTLEWCLRQLSSRGRGSWASVVQATFGLLVLFTVVEMFRLHPYQYVYFNQISGGLNSAFNRDETDYWGLSHKEAADWLNAYAQEHPPEEATYRIHIGYTYWMLDEALSDDFVITSDIRQADFSVAITRLNFHRPAAQIGQLSYVVERLGVPLCLVYAIPKLEGDDSTVPVATSDLQ